MKLPFVPQICQLGIVKSTFELQLSATLGLWIVFFLNLNIPTNSKITLCHPWGWIRLQMNIQILFQIAPAVFHWKLNQLRLTAHFSISWTATLILTTGKTKHFLFKNAPKKGFKNSSKMQLLFQNASKMLRNWFKMQFDS